jgi:MFS family permease
VLIGCLCLTIPTYGLMSAIGLFQTYWQGHQLAAESPTRISWILSVFGFLDCLFCIVVGAIFDRFQPRYYLPAGCLVYTAAFLGLGWASTYAQFLGCFVVGGIFAGESPSRPPPPERDVHKSVSPCRHVLTGSPL